MASIARYSQPPGVGGDQSPGPRPGGQGLPPHLQHPSFGGSQSPPKPPPGSPPWAAWGSPPPRVWHSADSLGKPPASWQSAGYAKYSQNGGFSPPAGVNVYDWSRQSNQNKSGPYQAPAGAQVLPPAGVNVYDWSRQRQASQGPATPYQLPAGAMSQPLPPREVAQQNNPRPEGGGGATSVSQPAPMGGGYAQPIPPASQGTTYSPPQAPQLKLTEEMRNRRISGLGLDQALREGLVGPDWQNDQGIDPTVRADWQRSAQNNRQGPSFDVNSPIEEGDDKAVVGGSRRGPNKTVADLKMEQQERAQREADRQRQAAEERRQYEDVARQYPGASSGTIDQIVRQRRQNTLDAGKAGALRELGIAPSVGVPNNDAGFSRGAIQPRLAADYSGPPMSDVVNRQPPFTQSTSFGGKQYADQGQAFAQRDAFIQSLNNSRAGQAQQWGQGNYQTPTRDFGSLMNQASDMVKGGWQNPLQGLLGSPGRLAAGAGNSPIAFQRFGKAIA